MLQQITVGHPSIVHSYGRMSIGSDQSFATVPPMGRKRRDDLIDAGGRTFSDRLKEAMRHAKLPADDGGTALGARVGVNRRTAHQWLNGTIPEVRFIIRIAQALGVDCTWLVTGEGEMVQPVQRVTAADREIVHLGRRLTEERRQQWIATGYELEQGPGLTGLQRPARTRLSDTALGKIRQRVRETKRGSRS